MICQDLPAYLAPILWLRPLGTFFVEGFSEWFSFSRCFSLLAPKNKSADFQKWRHHETSLENQNMGTSWVFHDFPWFSYMFLDLCNITAAFAKLAGEAWWRSRWAPVHCQTPPDDWLRLRNSQRFRWRTDLKYGAPFVPVYHPQYYGYGGIPHFQTPCNWYDQESLDNKGKWWKIMANAAKAQEKWWENHGRCWDNPWNMLGPRKMSEKCWKLHGKCWETNATPPNSMAKKSPWPLFETTINGG